jgi:outer membrane protease
VRRRKEFFVTRVPFCIAVIFGIALSAVAAHAAAGDDAQWPSLGDDAQWPSVKLDDAPPINPKPAFIPPDEPVAKSVKHKPVFAPETNRLDITGSTAEWPNVKLDETPQINPKPAFVAHEPATKPASRNSVFAPDTGRLGARDSMAADLSYGPKALRIEEEPQPSAFAFEAGARYWYSFGNYRFAFSNGVQGFGTPTSTLDWKNLEAHSGEAFARLDHKPTGVFVKGLLGGGAITSGYIDDKDFFEGQGKFSDTRSQVQNGSLAYAMIDVGWSYQPAHNVKVGVFAGYHYWSEKATAYGLLCKQQQPALGCAFVGAVPFGYDLAVGRYEPTWHAVRLGMDAKVVIDRSWSVSGEIAAVPYAALENKDSHLLRQSYADLGPAPNIISDSSYAYGVEAEMFVNYAVTPNIEIGTGLRYWGLFARSGSTRFGPDFSTKDRLDNFDQQRYGVLAHIKGKF